MTEAHGGSLVVVGLGPGPERWVTPAARQAVAQAQDLFGYKPYLDRIVAGEGQTKHASDNREELARAEQALRLAVAGRRVVVVSGGDPGVFAMAAAVCEAVERGPAAWREIDISIEPGVTAMLAAAARVGAPLGGDFCAISLSDNLKPWEVIERRLRLAAQADLVIALYNAVSKARPHQLARALALLGEERAGATPVVLATAVGRADEAIEIQRLDAVDVSRADMRTLVIIGASGTRCLERPGRPPLVYTERFVEKA